ncbi:hypothetical protein ONE63_011318 [Megalurothrips usitatus]|uniref:Protein takeout-like n=1 Tax=Megalurothrips usitatus TaxID=439358 RepID=A0AAV7X3K9_9NEOP|nr:hypothetical protein ONE63_011318 [Megalurothrips usitatus]
MSSLNIEQGSGAVAVDLHFKDLNIYGFKNGRVPAVKYENAVNVVGTGGRISTPDGITLKGNYKIDGKVLVLPIKGEGKCELSLANVTAEVEIVGKQLTKNGQIYVEVMDFKFTFNTTRLKSKFENLFNGNKELSAQMNVFLNENWNDILQELKPAVQDAFGSAFHEITNRIFAKVPFDSLFL